MKSLLNYNLNLFTVYQYPRYKDVYEVVKLENGQVTAILKYTVKNPHNPTDRTLRKVQSSTPSYEYTSAIVPFNRWEDLP